MLTYRLLYVVCCMLCTRQLACEWHVKMKPIKEIVSAEPFKHKLMRRDPNLTGMTYHPCDRRVVLLLLLYTANVPYTCKLILIVLFWLLCVYILYVVVLVFLMLFSYCVCVCAMSGWCMCFVLFLSPIRHMAQCQSLERIEAEQNIQLEKLNCAQNQ